MTSIRSIRFASAFLGAMLLAASGAGLASAQNCVSACLGKEDGCLKECLSQQQAPGGKPANRIQSDRQPGSVILHCTQLPVNCSSNSDCTCSGCCGDMAGVHVCQPSC